MAASPTIASRPLRILYATAAYKPAYCYGGPIESVAAAAEMLSARGHQVSVFTTNAGGDNDLKVPVGIPQNVNGVEVWYFQRRDPFRGSFPHVPYLSQTVGYHYAPAMKRALIEQIDEFDLVHTQAPFSYPTLAAGRAALQHHRPLFFSARGGFDRSRLRFRGVKKRAYIKTFLSTLLAEATTLIALTDVERNDYESLGFSNACETIPNGVDAARYWRHQRGMASEHLKLRENATVILFMARLHQFKGADILLNAFSRIAGQFPNAALIMAGPDEQSVSSRYRDRIRKAGILNRVTFPGMVSGDLKHDLLARADLFCLPSVGEGFSMTVLEAMASGTPVMVSPECRFPGVETARAGWVVERSEDDWARALKAILSQPAEISRRKANASHLVASSFTWDQVTTKLVRAYRTGIDRHASRADGT